MLKSDVRLLITAIFSTCMSKDSDISVTYKDDIQFLVARAYAVKQTLGYNRTYDREFIKLIKNSVPHINELLGVNIMKYLIQCIALSRTDEDPMLSKVGLYLYITAIRAYYLLRSKITKEKCLLLDITFARSRASYINWINESHSFKPISDRIERPWLSFFNILEEDVEKF
jgi:hypothetical protein